MSDYYDNSTTSDYYDSSTESESDDGSTTSEFTFGTGIKFALDAIAFPENARYTYGHDAQVIENALIKAISRYDPMFSRAFKGLSLTGSYLDNIKINLPDEFDMQIKIRLNCYLTPVLVPNRPGFIFLRASNGNDRCVRRFNGGYFVCRNALQAWFRDNIENVIPQLQNIRCTRRRSYSLKYTAHGHGVAHSLLATEHHDRYRQISFDFVPVFEFSANEWPTSHKPPNAGLSWCAVPRKYVDRPKTQDSRSFIFCASHWERLVLSKKQNLKDSLRLMKALRDANKMYGLISYFLKSIYLNKVSSKNINWNQAPGRLLIRMLVNLLDCLMNNYLPFYLAPDQNLLDKLTRRKKWEYIYIIRRQLTKLIRRRNANYLTEHDLYDIFGVEVD